MAQGEAFDKRTLEQVLRESGRRAYLEGKTVEIAIYGGTYPSEDEPGLRVMLAAPEYLFAMKCRAMRIGGVDENADIEDIRKLAGEIGIETASQALDLVAAFYPRHLIAAKTQFGIEEIFEP